MVSADRLRRILDLVDDSLGEPGLTGDDLAGRAYLSRFHFYRLVAAALGEPPGAFRRRLLLERAACRLMVTDDQVIEVALDAGYGSPEAFTRAFGRAFGTAPSAWRKNAGARHELAAASGRSPLEFRLAHLGDPRAREVLEAAAHAAGWDGTPSEPAGRGSGVALARYKNSAAYAAVVVSLRVDDATAAISLERIVIAADCGEVVDPSGAINQLEGGALQSASWTLKEQVAFDETSVTSIDWDSYPILRFSEVPAVDTHLLDRPGLPFLGTGEATQGPTAAAIANAVADAVGLRLRDTPFTPARVREAALAAA